MLFISWGSKSVFKRLADAGVRWCSVCEKDRDFFLALMYRVHHILWLIRWSTRKTYVRSCEVCNQGAQLDASEVEADLGGPQIPFMDRQGWMVGAGVVVAIGLFAFTVERRDHDRDLAYLAQPQVRDLYEINLAKLSKHPEHLAMYATVRVSQTSAEGVEVELPNGYYSGLRGVTESVSNGNARADSYYSADRQKFTREQLVALREDGTITKVDR